MPRPSQLDRYRQLLRAAIAVFSRKGLHRSQMSEIASEAGVSAGTLYTYFESKDALFFALVERALLPPPETLPQLPIREPPRDALLSRLQDQVREHYRLAPLDEALQTTAPPDPRAEVAAIVDGLYALTERTADWVDVLERSAQDTPELAAVFMVEVRRGLFRDLATWIGKRQAGGLHRPHLDPAVAGRMVVETITLFARHRRRDPDPQPLAEAAVRSTLRAMLVDGLVLSPTSAPAPHPTE